MPFFPIQVSPITERLRLRNIRWPRPKIEAFGTRDDFIEGLEELTVGSRQVCFLDSSNMAPHLIEARHYLRSTCVPLGSYRHVANVENEEELEHLVRFIQDRHETEKGTYFCLHEDPLYFASLSYCVVERDDELYVFLIHDDRKVGEKAQVVRIQDRNFGRFMLEEYGRLWDKLEADKEPLSRDGKLSRDEEIQLRAALASSRKPETPSPTTLSPSTLSPSTSPTGRSRTALPHAA